MSDDARLLPAIANRIRDPGSEIHLSAVSAWEIVIKERLGKLRFPVGELETQVSENDFHGLPITIAHARALAEVPQIHRDPFDRMLVAQAQTEGLALLTQDETLLSYPGIDGSHPWKVMDAERRSYATPGTRC